MSKRPAARTAGELVAQIDEVFYEHREDTDNNKISYSEAIDLVDAYVATLTPAQSRSSESRGASDPMAERERRALAAYRFFTDREHASDPFGVRQAPPAYFGDLTPEAMRFWFDLTDAVATANNFGRSGPL